MLVWVPHLCTCVSVCVCVRVWENPDSGASAECGSPGDLRECRGLGRSLHPNTTPSFMLHSIPIPQWTNSSKVQLSASLGFSIHNSDKTLKQKWKVSARTLGDSWTTPPSPITYASFLFTSTQVRTIHWPFSCQHTQLSIWHRKSTNYLHFLVACKPIYITLRGCSYIT